MCRLDLHRPEVVAGDNLGAIRSTHRPTSLSPETLNSFEWHEEAITTGEQALAHFQG